MVCEPALMDEHVEECNGRHKRPIDTDGADPHAFAKPKGHESEHSSIPGKPCPRCGKTIHAVRSESGMMFIKTADEALIDHITQHFMEAR